MVRYTAVLASVRAKVDVHQRRVYADARAFSPTNLSCESNSCSDHPATSGSFVDLICFDVRQLHHIGEGSSFMKLSRCSFQSAARL
jgi:hypothetical protein